MHLRLLERLQTGRVSVGDGLERACSADLHLHESAVDRNRISVLVDQTYIDIAEILSVSLQYLSVWCQTDG